MDMELIESSFEIVDNSKDAEFIIAQSTLWNGVVTKDLKKTIYIAVEPPLSSHRIECYNLFHQFHTVITHNPISSNEFAFTENDEAQFFPVRSDPFTPITRKDTRLRNRGVFYAGMIGAYEDVPDSCGGINITGLRKILGDYFKDNFKGSKFIGVGWDGQKTKVAQWRKDKMVNIDESECDFVLALENTIYPNYLYEKIWDGINTDRVTLYLGDPNIENHIPIDCFIDLRPFFDTKTKVFDTMGLGRYLNNMSQKTYDQILKNAREFRETSKGKYNQLQKELTEFIIKRIKNEE